MSYTNKRISFSKNSLKVDYPDFLELQIKSFKKFFQLKTTSDEKINKDLYKVFKENFPVNDVKNIYNLEFIDYFIDPPKYSVDECIRYGLTYNVSLKAKLKLSCNDDEHEEFKTIVQDVYLGNIPYMTSKGSFVINGIERVVVSQLHRSPGVFFAQSRHNNGIKLYSARVIPFKGAWIEFATDMNYIMYAYIDRKKKFPVTTLLRAIGYGSDDDILKLFDIAEEAKVDYINLQKYIGYKLAANILKTWIEDFVDEDTGEVISVYKNDIVLERGILISNDNINTIVDSGVKYIMVINNNFTSSESSIIYNTLQKDVSNSEKEAVEYIYKQLRNSEPPDEETAKSIIDKLFFSDKRYDLGNVGRYRINRKLNIDIPSNVRVLTKKDIIYIVKYLIKLVNSKEDIDDIDHLSNRRVKTVGEQLYTQFCLGFSRMTRTIRERMNIRDNEVFAPVDLINARILSSVINSFFGTNQLSQFMDQTNILSEITHKRRLSALGPGGLSRERAGFEVRDVHHTHYGRLCTIETPEGPNIGLISSLCVYAKINDLGFIETPYRKVTNGKVSINEKPIYLSAEEEDDKIITQANTLIDSNGNFTQKYVKARYEGDFSVVASDKITLMDIASNQITSIASSLIPFLEHDDANRALMGSNMQRQAVPLLYPESPVVGTGLEQDVVKYSGSMINAENDGIIQYVDSSTIIIKYDLCKEKEIISFENNIKQYNLTKFKKTNQNTCINLKPIVKMGERVVKNQVLCEGYSTQQGELALGRNLKVAFMPWQGFNFEDAIVISENVVKNDLLTSIYIEEYELDVRDTKRGKEEFSSDIPNVSDDAVRKLDENGIIMIGSNVKPGDILIGKITPKGEVDPSPEEKLLRAIFGDKAGDVKDTSLRASQSVYGTVINTQLLTRLDKSKLDNKILKKKIKELESQYNKNIALIKNQLVSKILTIIDSNIFEKEIKDINGNIIINANTNITDSILYNIDYSNINSYDLTNDDNKNKILKQLISNYLLELKKINNKYKRNIFSITVGDELPSGVLKRAKVTIAQKRKLKVGDKIAGRHGNKGIIAKIVRQEDMPFLSDGTPIDIILNPLGVPSRMNIGQIYETILGWAGDVLNIKFSSPIFDGASYKEVDYWINKANLPKLGATYLYNGLTGERFHSSTTVGIIYIMKLGHMADDKMHARSIGPYSLVMQQPLGGKSQFGGQRIGEMEVWALEAFGASNILREILTLKSDDISSRSKAYGAIVKGNPLPVPGVPESFNVLVHELMGLCLEIKFK